MNSNMVKPKKCGYLHLVYHFTVPLMIKELAQIKVYTYFNIGDAKTLVKLKEK